MLPNGSGESFRAKLSTILFLTGIFFVNFTCRVILGPLMPAIEADLSINHTQAGGLFLLLSIGYFVSVVGSGFISARLGHRGTIILGALSLALALFVLAGGRSLWAARAALVLLGLTSGLYLPSGMALLMNLVQPRNLGKAVAIHELAPTIGFILCPMTAEFLLQKYSWRAAPFLFGVLSAAGGLAFLIWGRKDESKGEAPSPRLLRSLVGKKPFWIIMALFGLGVTAEMGIYSMLPLFLVAEKGFSRPWANTLLALSRLPGPLMSFTAGWLTDRLGPARALTIILLAAGLSTLLLGLGSGNLLLAMIFLQPSFAICFFPAGFTALSHIGRPSERNVVLSFTAPLAVLLGSGVLPAALGWMGEHLSFSLGLSLSGVLILSGAFLTRFLSENRGPGDDREPPEEKAAGA
ncbi:MAG: MFS transporter [Pseudomonadota bacterium]